MSGQKQHVDIHRKQLLRRELLDQAPVGACYVPFIGDGDLAQEYEGRTVWGADLEPARVEVAKDRVEGTVIVADCNEWPFPDCHELFALADLDAYSNPYMAFDAFLDNARIGSTVVVFGTDGLSQRIKRSKVGKRLPSGEEYQTDEWRSQYNTWWEHHVLPWIVDRISPKSIVVARHYRRGDMLYWGIVASDETAGAVESVLEDVRSGVNLEDALTIHGVAEDEIPESDVLKAQTFARAKLQKALHAAASSGNVPALQLLLSRQQQPRSLGGASDPLREAIDAARQEEGKPG